MKVREAIRRERAAAKAEGRPLPRWDAPGDRGSGIDAAWRMQDMRAQLRDLVVRSLIAAEFAGEPED